MRPDEHTSWRLPQCMSCKKPWDDTFIRNKFPKSFVEGELKSFMKAWLIDHEKTFLQDTVAQVEREVSRKREFQAIQTLRECLNEEKHKLKVLQSEKKDNTIFSKEKRANLREAKKKNEDIDSITELLEKCKLQETTFTTKIEKTKYNIKKLQLTLLDDERKYYYGENGDEEKKERATFIKPCPVNDCKGFLSNKYKCGLCTTYCCSDCFEIIGKLQGDDDSSFKALKDKHKCDPANVETAKMIRKECKPCPKCGVQIFRISGCNQMWCTSCHTAFDFVSGKVDTGLVHNPHYAQYMREQREGQGEVVRGERRVAFDPCAEAIGQQQFLAKFQKIRTQSSAMSHGSSYMYRLRNFFGYNTIPDKAQKQLDITHEIIDKACKLAGDIERWNNHLLAHHRSRQYDQRLTNEIRKKYVKNEYDEKQWQVQAMRKYKQLTYDNHIADITQTFVQISRDILRQILEQIDMMELDAKEFCAAYGFQLRTGTKKIYLTGATMEVFKEPLKQLEGFITYMNGYIKDLSVKNGYSSYYQMKFVYPDYLLWGLVSSKSEDE
jgi:hypothetical protein